jgi:DNA-binding Lrp family transcriptional regulator
MRYSILGFNQERVLSLFVLVPQGAGKEPKRLSLDVNDLLILNLLSDFPNREGVKKILKDNRVFFWASYDEIIEELPILNIKKQALSDRLDKMVKLNVIMREFVNIDARHHNATFFSLTHTYEELLYNFHGYRSQLREGIVVNYDIYNIADNNNIIKEKEILKEKKSEDDAFVDKIYAMYPTRCPVRNLSLGKGYKDKDRIRKLLKMYSKEDIEKVVRHEISEKYNKSMMSNFSTFLNNFPDPNSLEEVAPQEQELTLREKCDRFLEWLCKRRGEKAMMAYKISINDFSEMYRHYNDSAKLCEAVMELTKQPIMPNEKLIDLFRRQQKGE